MSVVDISRRGCSFSSLAGGNHNLDCTTVRVIMQDMYQAFARNGDFTVNDHGGRAVDPMLGGMVNGTYGEGVFSDGKGGAISKDDVTSRP